jgi:hypothetical protein
MVHLLIVKITLSKAPTPSLCEAAMIKKKTTFSLHVRKFRWDRVHTAKKRLAVFPSPAGMSLTKLSLAGNNLNIPG